MVVGGCHWLVAEPWQLKPEALGSIPGSTTFLSFPLPFQRSTDSNSPDNLYWSSDLDEPVNQAPYAVMKLRFFRNLNPSSFPPHLTLELRFLGLFHMAVCHTRGSCMAYVIVKCQPRGAYGI